MGTIAILGGTGAEGFGLGLRFAMCGDAVRIGSRLAPRAIEVAAHARQQLSAVGCTSAVSGHENHAAIDGADMVVFAFPYAGISDLAAHLAAPLAGRIVLDVVNPLVVQNGIFAIAETPAGSAAETIQQVLPESHVVSAFKNESAEHLKRIDQPLNGDVLVCSNHADARDRVMDLVRRIPDLRPVDAGPLANARSLEAITALLLNLNRRHRSLTSIQIVGLHEKPHR